jgi:brefeldin A-resistance guanine nucleotide exchange factor 1
MKQEEAVPESLKNILLVMSSSGYLVSPSTDPSQEKLWTETWKRLDRFLPDLRKELELDPQVNEKVDEKGKEKEIPVIVQKDEAATA